MQVLYVVGVCCAAVDQVLEYPFSQRANVFWHSIRMVLKEPLNVTIICENVVLIKRSCLIVYSLKALLDEWLVEGSLDGLLAKGMLGRY